MTYHFIAKNSYDLRVYREHLCGSSRSETLRYVISQTLYRTEPKTENTTYKIVMSWHTELHKGVRSFPMALSVVPVQISGLRWLKACVPAHRASTSA